MKKTKSILFIVLCLLTVVMLGLFAACNDDDNGVPAGTFVAEAEYTNLQGVEGQGDSGGASGVGIISRDTGNLGASNGYYLTYLQSDGVTITFDIASSMATTAKLVIRVSTEEASIITPLSPDIYRITVNAPASDLSANEIDYTSFGLGGTANSGFIDVEIGTINLNQGSNRIRLMTIGNDLWSAAGGNTCAAPILDCIKLSEYGDATLSWTPRTQNIQTNA